jgi:hypothetical protein
MYFIAGGFVLVLVAFAVIIFTLFKPETSVEVMGVAVGLLAVGLTITGWGTSRKIENTLKTLGDLIIAQHKVIDNRLQLIQKALEKSQDNDTKEVK